MRKSLTVGLLVALALLAAQAIYLRDVTIDDVGISYRYARHLADGEGLTWNVGQPPVEGYSNLLWVLILAGARRLGLDIDLTARVLGVLLGAATLVAFSLLLRRIARDAPAWCASLPLFLVALNPAWVMWHLSGLEIGLYGFALVLTVLALTGSDSRKRRLLAAGTIILILTRPEGIALAPIPFILGWITDRHTQRRQRIYTYGIPLAAVLTVAAALVAFRLIYYGYPLPNTVYAKFSTRFPSARPVGEWFVYATPFWLAWLYAARRWTTLSEKSAFGTAIIMVGAQTLLVLPVNPVMNFLHRYLIAFLPLVAVPIPLALTALGRRWRWAPAAAAAALVVWSWQQWPGVVRNCDAQRYMYRRQQCVAALLLSLPGAPRIALGDAGRIPYWTNLPAVDVWGLCEPQIAHEGFSSGAILRGAPTLTDIYIAPLRTRGDTLQAMFGYDKIVLLQPYFQENFRLWSLCAGEPEERRASSNRFWYLDYGIYMRTDFAERHGIPLAAGS